MEKICIDLDMAIGFLKGETTAVEKIKYYSGEELCVSVFTAYELLSTITKRDVVQQFLSNLTILPFDANSATIASNVRKWSDEKGIEISTSKAFNAAICISNKAYLVSKDHTQYDKIRGLTIV